MPELPEVETTRLGIAPHIQDREIERVIVRDARLRWPVPAMLGQLVEKQTVRTLTRRAKYLLLNLDAGSLILHLGMSGSLRILQAGAPPAKHDHVDLIFSGNTCLRFRDPRRFGCILWTRDDPLAHPLLASLGPEPLDDDFSGAALHGAAKGRTLPVKSFIMDQRVVVGVGNIYANEALFFAKLHPQRAAGSIGIEDYRQLAASIRSVLSRAIRQGGTTLRDFVNEAGKPGYFQQELNVYGRAGRPCNGCGRPICSVRLAQRAAFFCPQCQPA